MSFDPEFNPYAAPKTELFAADDDFSPIYYIHDDYGGFWRRLGAYAIDYIVTIVVAMLVGVAAGMFLPAVAEGEAQAVAFSSADLVGWLIASTITLLYFTMMESSSLQATLGKLALGLKVTDLDGRRISFPRACGRYFAKLLSALICNIGFLMIAWDARKQGLHDQIAGTFVVRAR